VTLEQFESYALNRLRVLAEIESSFVRNRTQEDLRQIIITQQKKYLPLNSNTAVTIDHDEERKRDHVSHFVLRLAFCRSEELRKRFVKAEGTLFKVRWETDDRKERAEWLRSRDFGWVEVSWSSYGF
jgi:DNA primase large subunit